MAAGAATAFHRLDAGAQRLPDDGSLGRPCAGELQKILAGALEIEAGAQHTPQLHRVPAAVPDNHRARDRIPAGEDGVEQRDGQAGFPVGQIDFERVRLALFFDVGGGQPGQLRFAGGDAMASILQIHHTAAIGKSDLDGRRTVIASPVAGVFPWQQLEAVVFAGRRLRARTEGPSAVGDQVLEISSAHARAPIEVKQAAARSDGEGISAGGSVKEKGLGTTVKDNRHEIILGETSMRKGCL